MDETRFHVETMVESSTLIGVYSGIQILVFLIGGSLFQPPPKKKKEEKVVLLVVSLQHERNNGYPKRRSQVVMLFISGGETTHPKIIKINNRQMAGFQGYLVSGLTGLLGSGEVL